MAIFSMTGALDPRLIDQALEVTLPLDELTHDVGRVIIDGAVVIYNLDSPPEWLVPILAAREED